MLYKSEKEMELQSQLISQTRQPDFKEFWDWAVAQLRAVPVKIKRKKLDTPYEKLISSWEISYNTHDDTWIDAWFSCPVGAKGKLPCVVYFHGGGGQKDLHLDIVATGVACFAMDVRGQGGTSIDRGIYSSGDVNGGLMTRGIMDPEEFYMRNIFLDAVRAVDVAACLPEVDSDRIVTYGASQGGGLSVVASGLGGKSIAAYICEPSFCCLKERTILGSRIFSSTNGFLNKHPEYTDHVFQVLSYFDVNNMVSFLKIPSVFALGLADDVCLPHFVYSAYHHTQCEKELHIYPFTPHCVPQQYKDLVYRRFAQM